MLKAALKIVTEGKNLSESFSEELIENISLGKESPVMIGAFLAALKAKKEAISEITGFARGMRKLAARVNTGGIENIVDSCGTGGDGSNTFNISTASAILASSLGVNVAKHSNFGQTSRCGSSNVLEALNIPLLKTPEEVEKSLRSKSIAFIHAPYFHKSTASVAPVRKELGIKTIFNYLGPITNPAFPQGQVLGVANPDLLFTMARVLINLGCKRALIVSGANPVLDEISVCGRTFVCEVNNGSIQPYEIEPEDLGLDRADISDLAGGDPDQNAGIIKGVFKAEITGAKLNAVLVNTAALLFVADRVQNLQEGVILAKDSISSGHAYEKLEGLRS